MIGTTIDSREGTAAVRGFPSIVIRYCRNGLVSAKSTTPDHGDGLVPVAESAPRYSTTSDVPTGSDFARIGV